MEPLGLFWKTLSASTLLSSPTPLVKPTAAASPPDSLRRWLCLVVALVGPFLGVADLFIVNVSIPAIRAGLGATFAQIQLVVAGYGLAYAVCLITGGRLGDIFGRRRLFLLGMGSFTLVSVLCGFAPTANLLVFWRVVQGAAAALMFPQTLAYIQVLFTGAEKRAAFSAFGVALGLGSILGQMGGGFLVDANLLGFGWRAVFLINVPVGALAIWAASRLLPESRSGVARKLDLGGTALITLGLFLLCFPMVEGREQSWPAWAFVMLAAAIPALWAFYKFEQRKSARLGADAVLVEPALFQDRAFVAGLGVTVSYFAGHASMLFMLTLYFQLALHLTATQAGLALVPFSAFFLAGSSFSSKVSSRLGRGTLHLGAAISGLGLAMLLGLRLANVGVGFAFEAALALYGVGRGFMIGPLFNTVLGGIRHANAGAASGVLSTAQQIAHAIGVAVIGSIVISFLPPTPGPDDYAHGFGLTCVINLVLLALASALVLILPKEHATPPAAATAAVEAA